MLSIIKKSYHPKLKQYIQRCYCCKIYKENVDNNLPMRKPTDCDGQTKKWPSGNRIQYKFHLETENAFNQQIHTEFHAFYNYLSMSTYFGRVDVALPGCESYFIQMHSEEREHALKFLNYVKMRGGLIKLYPIQPPIDQDWKCPLHAFKVALDLEMEISNKLVSINSIAEKHGDLNACDFIVTEFMENQMKSINELAKFVTILSGIGDETLSRFIFDKDLLSNHVFEKFNIFKNNRKKII